MKQSVERSVALSAVESADMMALLKADPWADRLDWKSAGRMVGRSVDLTAAPKAS